jgi:hypothetical protein
MVDGLETGDARSKPEHALYIFVQCREGELPFLNVQWPVFRAWGYPKCR